MDLNHIKLPATVIADLYKSSLVEREENLTKSPASTKTGNRPAIQKLIKWKSLGNNLKHIMVIVNKTDVIYLPDNELIFLTGILAACKLNIGDVAIFNLGNHPGTTYKDLVSYFKSKNVFLFGVEPVDFGLPMNFPHFQQQKFTGITFLFSPSLNELENDKLLKSKLWICLKQIFNI
jgi:hypothetical protein